MKSASPTQPSPQPTPQPNPTPSPTLGNAFYVSSQSGDDTNAGTQVAPFRTIQRAIDSANSSGGGAIMVTGGRYAEALTLESNIEIAGAFNPNTWMRDPANFNTVVGTGPTAVAGNGVMNVTLRDLTIQSDDNTSQGGSSVAVALVASNGVEIVDNEIVAGNAGPGFSAAAANGGGNGSGGGRGSNAGSNAGRGGTGGGGGSTNTSRRGGDGGQGAFGVVATEESGDSGNAGSGGALGGTGGGGSSDGSGGSGGSGGAFQGAGGRGGSGGRGGDGPSESTLQLTN